MSIGLIFHFEGGIILCQRMWRAVLYEFTGLAEIMSISNICISTDDDPQVVIWMNSTSLVQRLAIGQSFEERGKNQIVEHNPLYNFVKWMLRLQHWRLRGPSDTWIDHKAVCSIVVNQYQQESTLSESDIINSYYAVACGGCAPETRVGAKRM